MSGGSFHPAADDPSREASGMGVPALSVAEATGSAYLAKLGARSIAEARKLTADAARGGQPAGAWRSGPRPTATC